MKARDLLLYHTEDQKVNVSVYFQNGSFWLTQKAMAELFGVNVPAVSKHLKNIFDTKELDVDSVVSILEITASDSKTYSTKFYRLEAILAVGYRVNSVQATDFRKWANKLFLHLRVWMNCIRNGGNPSCGIIEGFEEAITAHMGGLSYKIGRRIEWDAENEQIIALPGENLDEILLNNDDVFIS
ncbi:RhuM family protein [Cognataquiflexum rubidum]|uniref:RhuM family protein n=1 Tax=Cognataquiflexum rubidum TaxID=2922273 RepID=UPI001F139F80|nr:RhuM family protein [Cognataquiflexum rubidum]MCH6232369.1 virulence RhuM family protein [Cognataquiflexum rubidum]